MQLYLVDEDRFNWRIYLKKAMSSGQPEIFDQALSSCKMKDDRQQVLRAKAEYFFLHGDNRNAVQQLGSTGFVTFDEAVLRILGVCPMLLDTEIQGLLASQQQELALSARRNGSVVSVNLRGVMRSIFCESDINQSHLRRYLLEVLQKLPGSAKAQRTMVATWVSEIFLHELSSQALGRQVQREGEQLRVGAQPFSTWRELLSDRVSVSGLPLETEFNQFLTAYKLVLYFFHFFF